MHEKLSKVAKSLHGKVTKSMHAKLVTGRLNVHKIMHAKYSNKINALQITNRMNKCLQNNKIDMLYLFVMMY